jgi:hypothetical protein
VSEIAETRRRLLTGTGVALVLSPALWHLRTLFTLVRGRLMFPLELEWLESGHLYHVDRLLRHLPIYVDPATGFAPYPYPPGYWIVVAAIGRLAGLDFWTGRAVSSASIVATMLLLGLILFRSAACSSRALGVAFAGLGAGSIAAGYPIGGASFDLARPDALATFLVIAAAALVGDRRTSLQRTVAVVVVATAAIWVKQTNVLFVGWLVAFALGRDRRGGLAILVATTALSIALFGILQAMTGGWFSTWFFLMRHHPITWSACLDPLLGFLRHAPFLVGVPPLSIWLWRRRWLRRESVKWLGMLGAAIVSSTLAYAKVGGWLNVYTPVLFLAWPVSLFLVADLTAGLAERPVVPWALTAAASIFLFVLRYPSSAYVPTPAMWQEAERFHGAVAGLDGDVVIVVSAFTAVRGGKRASQPILSAYNDAALAGMPVDLAKAVDDSGARWVVLTGTAAEETLAGRLAPTFVRVREIHAAPSSPGVERPFPRTLWRRRPPLGADPTAP